MSRDFNNGLNIVSRDYNNNNNNMAVSRDIVVMPTLLNKLLSRPQSPGVDSATHTQSQLAYSSTHLRYRPANLRYGIR